MSSILTLVHDTETKDINLNVMPHLVVVAPEAYTIKSDAELHDGDTENLSKIVKAMNAVYTQMEEQKVTSFTALQGSNIHRHLITFSNLDTVKEAVMSTAEQSSAIATILRLGRAAGFHIIINTQHLDENLHLNRHLTIVNL